MPFSYSAQLSTLVGFAERLQPKAVLDVGTGMGQYGFLLRTNLEHTHLFEVQGSVGWQRPREQWQVRIDGIEGCREYLTPVHHYAYTTLLLGDALEQLRLLPAATYDLVLAIDIVEHFHKADGERFLRECQRVCRGAVVVSTPKDFIAQEVEANPLENHRSHWTRADLAACGFNALLPSALSWIGVSWHGAGPLPAGLFAE